MNVVQKEIETRPRSPFCSSSRIFTIKTWEVTNIVNDSYCQLSYLGDYEIFSCVVSDLIVRTHL